MKMHVLKMYIVKEQDEYFTIEINNDNNTAIILFSPSKKTLEFLNTNELVAFLRNNEYQLRKILHNKRRNTFYVGFKLTFALRENKDVAAFNDRSKIVVLDKTNDTNDSYVVDGGKKLIHEIYIDASFLYKYNSGGVAILHKDLANQYHLYVEQVEEKSSSLLELIAAIKAIEVLHKEQSIRIITDSQYVRKGLTEWIVNWKLNDWVTANGEKVKNKKWWQKFDEITKGKYIEFEWVKGHSNHFENTICDLYAKEVAKNNSL